MCGLIRTCLTTVLLSAMSECVSECCTERLNDKRGTALYEMADLYAPQGVDLGGGGSPSVEWNDTVGKKVACVGIKL